MEIKLRKSTGGYRKIKDFLKLGQVCASPCV